MRRTVTTTMSTKSHTAQSNLSSLSHPMASVGGGGGLNAFYNCLFCKVSKGYKKGISIFDQQLLMLVGTPDFCPLPADGTPSGQHHAAVRSLHTTSVLTDPSLPAFVFALPAQCLGRFTCRNRLAEMSRSSRTGKVSHGEAEWGRVALPSLRTDR